jgi:hypothetical protein
MMRKIILFFLLIPSSLLAQSTDQVVKRLGPDPLIIVDTIKTDGGISKVDVNTIAVLTVMGDTSAMKLYGDEAKDGAVIIETKDFAKRQYIAFFRKMSTQYDSLYTIANSDSTFQYIVNDKVKTGNYFGDLALIIKDKYVSMEILSADDLKKKYSITGKTYGILIHAIPPI